VQLFAIHFCAMSVDGKWESVLQTKMAIKALFIVLCALLSHTASAQVCAGQVTSFSVATIATADRVPGITGKAVTVTFTPQTSLAAGKSVTLNWPAGFFDGSTAPGVSGSTLLASTASISGSSWVVAGASTFLVGGTAYTITFTGVKMGPNPLADSSCGFTLQTDYDAKSTPVASGVLGGQVGTFSVGAISTANRVPATTGVGITVTFTPQTSLISGKSSITFNWPAGFFDATNAGTAPGVTGSSLLASTSSISGSSWVVAGASTFLVGGTPYTITFTGVKMGPNPLASNPAGFTLQTDVDMQSTAVAAGALGGQVGTFSVGAISTANRVPATTGVGITVTFTPQTSLATGKSITFNWPAGFFDATNAGTAPGVTGSTLLASTSSISGSSWVVGGASTFLVGGTAYTITFTGVKMGPNALAANPGCGFTLQTDYDLASTAVAAGALGGQVGTFSVTITTADRVPRITGKTVTVTFTPQTSLVTGKASITFNWPAGFFDASTAPSGVTGTSLLATGAPTVQGSSWVVAGASTFLVGGTSYTITFTGVKMGPNPLANNAAGFTLSTDLDLASTAVATGTLGGQVTGATLTGGSSVPGASAAVTVAFTLATALPTGAVTINWPAGMFASSGSYTVTGALVTSSLLAGSASTTGTTWVINIAGAGPALGAQTITVAATMGPTPIAQPCANSFWVSTTSDISSVTSTNSVPPPAKGQVTGVSFSVSSRAPTAATQTATVTFTLATALTSSQKITVNWPAGFFDSTAPSGVSGSALFATGAASVVGNSWTVTGAGNGPTAGTYTLIFAGVKMGPLALAANPVGITVSSDTDLVSAGATSGPLGGQITGVSVSIAAADRVPAATGKSVTVSFTTQFALTSGQLVTITFPSSFLTGTIAVTAAATFAATTTAVGTTGLTIGIGSAGAAVGSYTLTLTGATMPAKTVALTGACNNNFAVNTPFDLSGGAILPMIGGQVTGVSFSVASADRVPAATGKSVTVSFTTQTVLANAQLVTITFPTSYIAAVSGVTYAGAANTFAATATAVGTSSYTIAVGSAGAKAGSYTVTLTGATMGSPIAASATTGVTVVTTTDFAGNAGYPALGGAVTGATLTIATSDRVNAVANRKVVVSFTTATALVSGNFITVVLPSSFVTSIAASSVVTGISVSSVAVVGSNLVLTVGTGGVAQGASTVNICGVTLGSFPTNNLIGVQVMTTLDYTTTCSATGTVGTQKGQVTAVSMTMPFANRVAGNTNQAVTFSFTTATALPAASSNCGAASSVTINFPSGFFVGNAAGSCGAAANALSATGLTYALTAPSAGTWTPNVGPTSATTFVFSGTAALSAGTYTVTISGLTLGSQTAGVDSGALSITVQTSLDDASSGSPSGPISGYQVTSVTMPSSCQQSSTCQTVLIGFISTAGNMAAGSTLDITFTAAPVAGTAVPYMDGSALIVPGAVGGVTANAIRLTVNTVAPWVISSNSAAPTIITLAGLTIASTGLQSTPASVYNYVSVGTSTPAYSMPYSSTGTGTTTTTSLTINRPFPGVQNTQATIVFKTTNGIASGSTIRVLLPNNFFIDTPQVGTCTLTNSYDVGASGLAACSSVTPTSSGLIVRPLTPTGSAAITAANPSISFYDLTYTGTATAAGTQTVILSGVTLSATAKSATNFFSVVTTENSCSAGMISTGSISNSNPGGPSAPAATAASVFLSAAAALACALLLLL
jgi:hypothetical protein